MFLPFFARVCRFFTYNYAYHLPEHLTELASLRTGNCNNLVTWSDHLIGTLDMTQKLYLSIFTKLWFYFIPKHHHPLTYPWYITYAWYTTYIREINQLSMSLHQHYSSRKNSLQSNARRFRWLIIIHLWQWKLKCFILTFGARRFYLCSIHGNAQRSYLWASIGRSCASSPKLKGLILAFWIKRFHSYFSYKYPRKFYFTLLLEAIGGEKKDNRA